MIYSLTHELVTLKKGRKEYDLINGGEKTRTYVESVDVNSSSEKI